MRPHQILIPALLCVNLDGCATSERAGIDEVARALPRHPVVLLGEVHDNVAHHRLRHAALKLALEGGATPASAEATPYRPALLMEQFDRERQADIERARRAKPGDADHLIAQAAPAAARVGAQGWNWAFYKPFVELALRHDLPIIAANTSRADLMRVAKDGFGALFDAAAIRRLGLDRPLPTEIAAAQAREIDAGHCNALPAALLPAMARAQVARDAFMALKIEEQRARRNRRDEGQWRLARSSAPNEPCRITI